MNQRWEERLHDWKAETVHKLQRRWWLWPIILLAGLVWHAFCGAAIELLQNRGANAASRVLVSLHPDLVSLVLVTIFGIFAVLAIHSYFDTRSGPRHHPNLVIRSAKYGIDREKSEDVTLRLRAYIQADSIRIQVRNELLVVYDPYPGIGKILIVEYSHAGTVREIVRNEGAWLVIPEPAVAIDAGGLGTTPTSTPLLFDGFRAWRSPYAFPVPLGIQHLSMVWVKNNQLSSGRPISNVRGCVEYVHNGQPTFLLERVLWWEEHVTGHNRGLRKSGSVDLEANESQSFPVFMQGERLKHPQSAVDATSESTRDLAIGRWTARITVTADYQPPIKGEVEFTVYQEPGKPTLSVGCQPPLGVTRLPIESDWTD